jgi:hypothetical protein
VVLWSLDSSGRVGKPNRSCTPGPLALHGFPYSLFIRVEILSGSHVPGSGRFKERINKERQSCWWPAEEPVENVFTY